MKMIQDFSIKWLDIPDGKFPLTLTLNPLIIIGTTISRSVSVILLLTPNSINMLSQSVTPMAYRSLKTLAHVIFPWNYIKKIFIYSILQHFLVKTCTLYKDYNLQMFVIIKLTNNDIIILELTYNNIVIMHLASNNIATVELTYILYNILTYTSVELAYNIVIF